MFELTKHGFELSARKPLGDTAVIAVPESQSVFGAAFTVEIECVGVWEDVLISVCGLVGGDDAFSGFDGLMFLWVMISINQSCCNPL